MKKLLLLLFLAFAVFVVWNRYRLYMRDPLANVTRDGVKERGVQVFINYNNDVLLENDNLPAYVNLVQHDQHTGVPLKIKCVHYFACLLDADVATVAQGEEHITVDSMSNKVVQFHEGKRETVVTLW